MGLAVISWATLSPPETTGLMERWEQQRAVRVPWLAARLERAGLTLSFDPCGVSSVGRWCTQWFAAPDGVDAQPPVVWLEHRPGARPPCTEDAAVVADAVGGFLESVLRAGHPRARRLFARGSGEPGLGHLDPVEDPLPWQLVQVMRSVAVRGTRGRDLRADLIADYDAARARLAADARRVVRV